jgi:hypothetical protein
MADGREIEVRHPDAIAWDSPRAAICATPQGFEVIEVALITSLAVRAWVDTKDGNGGI